MTYQLINASAHKTGLADESVHCVITSPPYLSLRKYSGDQAINWLEMQYAPMPGLSQLVIPPMRCGLGEEPTPEAYIGHLILVMREMWRILRFDGTAWVNLGDSYNGSGGAGGDYGVGGLKEGQPKYPGRKIKTLKPKDMIMVPERFALACQADGWYVRSKIPWIKRNGMPFSGTDRPGNAIEDVYLLAKSQQYFYDNEAIKMPSTNNDTRIGRVGAYQERAISQDGDGTTPTGVAHRDLSTRTFRNTDMFFKTWQGMLNDNDDNPMALVVNTKGYSEAHFATWPEDLVEPMIKAGTSQHGVCSECGASYVRMIEKSGGNWEERKASGAPMRYGMNNNKGEAITNYGNSQSITLGWQPTCTCNAGEPIPATVLDCFNGSGTTGRVALQLGRSYIGVDVSNEYLTELAPERMSNVQIEMQLS